jgi:nitroimidazol reductase NimA-like FMN-containing flavoprotein (pyridoxamine 5'-phosphate oxidase superfamily)
MADNDPVTELLPLSSAGSTATSWEDATGHLSEAFTFWLASVRPDGRPHVMPVLGAWQDGAMYVCTPGVTRKAKNLSGNPNCVVTVGRGTLDLVVEGQATQVSEEAELKAVGEAYTGKYGWKVTLRDGMFFADNGSGIGEIPYSVFRISPTTAFGLGTANGFSATRWKF